MPERILIIDDHEDTVRVVKFILEQQGYDVISAISGDTGIFLAKQNKPDLILLDVMMPGIDGVEVCRELRADSNFDDVPIVMFTAKDQVDDKWAGFEAGADDYLTKPTDPEELDRRIQVLIKRAAKSDGLPHELAFLEDDYDEKSKEDEAPALEETLVQSLLPIAPPAVDEDIEVIQNLIAIVGVRGGVGTTTVAINLAASMADTVGQTYLVDLDLIQGHVAHYLQQKIADESLNDMSQLTNNLELARRWQRFSLSAGNGLQLILARPNLIGQWPVPTVSQIETLIEALAQSGQYIVVDAGRGFSPAAVPVLRRAGRVLVCIQPERVSLLAVRQFLKVLPAYMGPGAKFDILMTTMGIESGLPKSAVEDFIHHELLATIPLNSKEVAFAANHNEPFVRLRPDSKTADTFRKIVHQVTFYDVN